MTILEKKIRGNRYYYYQDNISTEDKNKVISTFIGRSDLSYKDLLNARLRAFFKHLEKIMRSVSVVDTSTYHFENEPIDEFLRNSFWLDSMIKLYEVVRGNIPKEELETFEKELFVKYVHGTTAIEGNTLSEGETYTLIEDNLSPKNKDPNEINEVYNYTNIREIIDSIDVLNERVIKRIHNQLMRNIRDELGKLIPAGKYRSAPANVKGASHSLSRPENISQDINNLVGWYYDGLQRHVHPVELASIFHNKFELIHPFSDGNGRTGREILNFMLRNSGFPPIYITPVHRSEYLNALQEADFSNYIPLIEFIFRRIIATIISLLTKTNMYQLWTNDFRSQVAQIGDNEFSNIIFILMDHLNKSREMP